MPNIDPRVLIEQYDGFLLDAFGVLVDGRSVLPGANDFLRLLDQQQKPYLILTNGALQNAEQTAKNYHAKGLDLLPPERILNSGALLGEYLDARPEINRRAFVIGQDVSRELAAENGVKVVDSLDLDSDIETLIIMDQAGQDLLTLFDLLISYVAQRVDRYLPLHLIVPNPDYFYPKGDGKFGVTAGCIAQVVEQALFLRYGKNAPQFIKLGKPFSPIFTAAKKRFSEASRLLMIGDQILTDIKGARDAGIDSCLVLSGITVGDPLKIHPGIVPDHVIQSLV